MPGPCAACGLHAGSSVTSLAAACDALAARIHGLLGDLASSQATEQHLRGELDAARAEAVLARSEAVELRAWADEAAELRRERDALSGALVARETSAAACVRAWGGEGKGGALQRLLTRPSLAARKQSLAPCARPCIVPRRVRGRRTPPQRALPHSRAP